MFKNKKVKTAILAAMLLALITPFALQVNAGIAPDPVTAVHFWSCSDIPLSYCVDYPKGCSGDIMEFRSCDFWCKTGDTVSSTICCHRYKHEPASPSEEEISTL